LKEDPKTKQDFPSDASKGALTNTSSSSGATTKTNMDTSQLPLKEEKGEEGEVKEEGEMSEELVGGAKGVFEDPATVEFSQFEPKPTKKQLKENTRKEKEEKHKKELEELIKLWNPKEDPNTTQDPFKTLFVARLNYETTETTLKNELELYGPIKKIRMVCDNNGKPIGYAFVEFEHQRDMKDAYKHADGKKNRWTKNYRRLRKRKNCQRVASKEIRRRKRKNEKSVKFNSSTFFFSFPFQKRQRERP